MVANEKQRYLLRQKPRYPMRQLNVRLPTDAFRNLRALQRYYARQAGLIDALSQAQTLELALRDAARAAKEDR